MFQHIKACLPGDQKILFAGGGAVVGFGVGVAAPGLGGLLSFGPLLMMILCLLPCLAPLLLLRRKDAGHPPAGGSDPS